MRIRYANQTSIDELIGMGLLQHSSHVGLSLALLFLCLFEILAEESCTGKHDSGASTLPPHLGSRAELMRRSVRDLRELLRKMKVVDSNTLSMAGVLEKEDLVKRIMEGATKQCDWTNAGGPGLRPTDAEMNIAVPAEKIGRQPHKMKIGRLNCIVLQTHAKPEASIVLMHGFGANAEDLVNVGRGLQQRLRNGAKLRFIFPEGPVVLQEGLFDGQTEDIMRDSQSRVAELLELEKNAFGLDDSKIIVAGFSQGSWLATQVALSSSDDYGGLAIFSGGMYMPQTWPQKMSKKGARLRVLQSHGTSDSILPYVQGKVLQKAFMKAGCEHDFISFSGDHTIPSEAIDKLASSLLAPLLS